MQSKREKEHPLKVIDAEIERKGILVLNDVTSLPVYDEPYVSSNLVVGLCLQGYVKAEYDMVPADFCAHDISVVFPHHIVMPHESSPDYKCILIAVSQEVLKEILGRKSYRAHASYHRRPIFHLTDEQFRCMHDCMMMMKSICNFDTAVPQHIIYGSFELLSDLIDFYREQNMPKVASHDEQMFLRFYECLVENYNVSREVSFYANKLCVSPKYFSGVIKRETGISAQKWIIDYVVIKAKAMLKHNTEMNIHQVSKAVGFQDQSSFTRFFRNNAGMSPLDYRKDKVIK